MAELPQDPESQALPRRVQGERLVHVHSRAGELWRERFAGAGEAIELDDPPAVLEVEALYASTDITRRPWCLNTASDPNAI